jgi:superfamily II DNA or RNA helicase
LIKLNIYNIYTIIEGNYPIDLVDKCCSYRGTNYFFSKAYQTHHWDGVYHLLKNGKFPTGLLKRVIRELEATNSKFIVEDKREQPKLTMNDSSLEGIELRDFQIEAIEVAKEKERGIFFHSCASGKTILVTSLIKTLGYPKSLYIVHRLSLLDQAKKVMEKHLDREIGMIQADNYDIQQITVNYTIKKYWGI